MNKVVSSDCSETARELRQLTVVGQTELRAQQAHTLQCEVAHRIVAHCCLEPLTPTETKDDSGHAVTGCHQGRCGAAALRWVRRKSHGLPQGNNIRCVRAAARQWCGTQPAQHDWRLPRLAAAAIAAVAVVLAGSMMAAYSSEFLPMRLTAPVAFPADVVHEAGESARVQPVWPVAALQPGVTVPPAPVMYAAPIQDSAANPGLENAADATATIPLGPLGQALAVQPRGVASLRLAEHALLGEWNIHTAYSGKPLCDVARSYGMRCGHEVGDIGALRRHNRPAILTLEQDDGSFSFGTLVALEGQGVQLLVGDEQVHVTASELQRHWNGEFVWLMWPPLDRIQTISAGSNGLSVLWLRRALDHVEGVVSPDRDKTVFDFGLQARLATYQARKGLVSDGIAGRRTLSHLLNSAGVPRGPVLHVASPQT